ncbi:MAG: hypothetical protein AAGD38_08190 [Acidobacteriota bacterium]
MPTKTYDKRVHEADDLISLARSWEGMLSSVETVVPVAEMCRVLAVLADRLSSFQQALVEARRVDVDAERVLVAARGERDEGVGRLRSALIQLRRRYEVMEGPAEAVRVLRMEGRLTQRPTMVVEQARRTAAGLATVGDPMAGKIEALVEAVAASQGKVAALLRKRQVTQLARQRAERKVDRTASGLADVLRGLANLVGEAAWVRRYEARLGRIRGRGRSRRQMSRERDAEAAHPIESAS